MNQQLTTAIILKRTDYGEADRILTVLTPDHGKLRLMAKGVRRVKSKLAGGIELFSVSHITYIPGRGDIGTLVSTRLDKHFGTIVKDIERVQLGYELIKRLDKATEDEAEPTYFHLLQQGFEALDSQQATPELIQLWFSAQLLKIGGHGPNLHTDSAGSALAAEQKYNFDIDAMTFVPHHSGRFTSSDIKVLRLLFGDTIPSTVAKIQGVDKIIHRLSPLVAGMLQQHN